MNNIDFWHHENMWQQPIEMFRKYAIERQMARSKCEKIDRGRQLEAIHVRGKWLNLWFIRNFQILMLQQSESIAEMKKKIQNEEDSEVKYSFHRVTTFINIGKKPLIGVSPC